MHPRSPNQTFNTPINGTANGETISTPDLNNLYVLGTNYTKLYGINAGAGNDKVTGGYGDDEIRGGDGNDTMSGSYGWNELIGGTGIDTVDYSRFGLDGAVKPKLGLTIALQEGTKHGNGTARSSSTGGSYFHIDDLTGFENVNGSTFADRIFGNDEGNNTIFGLAGKDFIAGKLGNDFLYGGTSSDSLIGGGGNDFLGGGDGNDTLDGSIGNDTFVGGKGRDIIIPQAGDDVFDYNRPSESTVSKTGRDLIQFATGDDKIDLENLDANVRAAGDQDFKLIGTKLFSGTGSNGIAGELAYRIIDGANGVKNTLLLGDINGDRKADFAIEVIGIRPFTVSDFDL